MISLVRNNHRSKEYIETFKLLDDSYLKGEKIRIVIDNFKVHTSEAIREYLAIVQGGFEFVFTPK